MEQKSAAEREEPQAPKEKILTKSTIVVIGIFVVLQAAFMVVVFWTRLFPGGDGKEGQPQAVAAAHGEFVSLGRLDMNRPMDPLRQSNLHISAMIDLEVPTERAQELSSQIKRLEPLLRQMARQSFNDADPQDLINERTVGVRNAIKNSVNQELGGDAVTDVVFSDYKTF